MTEIELPWPVVLASGSPRRRDLLGRLIADFEIYESGVDEESLGTLDPWETAEKLAIAKAEEVFSARQSSLVIGADTVVAYESDGHYVQLAKPANAKEAARMLRELSGRSHKVVTGVAVRFPQGGFAFSATTTVTFRDLSEEEIARYAQSPEPLDKAGGYAIQGGAATFVDSIEGSTFNVVGLPVELLADRLREAALQT